MSIVLRSNVVSQSAQRRLSESTAALTQSFSRLSSGMRINKAGDDAAGLAISSSLKTDARVFTQAVRNLNDGVSFLNIADSAINELTSVMVRLGELSTQSSNGTLSSTQRSALDKEADALIDEYNRILESTKFNNSELFNGSSNSVDLQAGYSKLTVQLGNNLPTSTWANGTYKAAVSYFGITTPTMATTGDFNKDGYDDVLLGHNQAVTTTNLLLSNSNGTLTAPVSVGTYFRPNQVLAIDVNKDGNLDVVANNSSGYLDFFVALGNGNGTFKYRVSYATSFHANIGAGDFNGDGNIDLMSGVGGGDYSSINISLGNGNGSFLAPVSYFGGTYMFTDPDTLSSADINGDGKQDIIIADGGSGADHISILIGNGDGSFQARTSYSAGIANPTGVQLADMNGDGITDVVGYGASSISMLLANSDGSLNAASVISSTAGGQFRLRDLNGDGRTDIIAASSSNNLSLFLNNGNGSFQYQNIAASGGGNFVTLGDVNGDGFDDLVTSNSTTNTVAVLFANSSSSQRLSRLDLTTQDSAKASLTTVSGHLQNLTSERSAIGVHLSRLSVAVSNLQQSVENYDTSASNIMDADIAQETAQLVRARILQQAGLAVLANANQAPALALDLLKSR